MEENKKIFIRGRKGHGNEIKKILEELGAKDIGESCDYEECIYYISHDNQIVGSFIDSELAQVIMDNYREIELPKQPWKDGDILISDKYGTCYAVFKSFINDETFVANFLIFDEEMRFGLITLSTSSTSSYRLANEKEKEIFHSQYSRLWSNLKAANTVVKEKYGI